MSFPLPPESARDANVGQECAYSTDVKAVATKSVLVTGASGFVGRALIPALVRSGYAVRAAVRRPVPFPSGVDIVSIPDFINSVDWNPILRGVNIVVHAAGRAHASPADSEYGEIDRVNRIATYELAAAAAAAGVDRFVYVSSVRAQVGPSATHVVRKRDEPRPTDQYGRSKLAAEFALRDAGVPYTVLRPAVIYGPNPKGNIATLVKWAKSPFPLPFSAFDNRRSLLSIDNFISAVHFVLDNPATEGGTYLIADAAPIALRDIFAVLRNAQGRRPNLIYFPPALLRFALRLSNRTELWQRIGGELVVDTSKLESLGWRPEIETRGGLAAMLHAGQDRNA